MPIVLNPWSYTYIRKLVEEATFLSKLHRLEPTPTQRAAMNYKSRGRFNIPFLGEYVPEGWERLDQEPVIVHLTGIKRVNPPAISHEEFYKHITHGHNRDMSISLGVIERGQTHALVAYYRKTLTPLDQV